MRGKNHVVVGSVVMTTMATVMHSVAYGTWSVRQTEVFPEVVTTIEKMFRSCAQSVIDAYRPDNGVLLVLAAYLFIVGTLFCDIDNKHNSLRYVTGLKLHVNLRHRGFLMSNWFFFAVLALGILDPTHVLLWFHAGISTHMFLDQLSYAGRAPWYPFGYYRVVRMKDGTEVVTSAYNGGYYATGEFSEIVVAASVIAVCCGIMTGCYLLLLH